VTEKHRGTYQRFFRVQRRVRPESPATTPWLVASFITTPRLVASFTVDGALPSALELCSLLNNKSGTAKG
jgi:hypothetical protein